MADEDDEEDLWITPEGVPVPRFTPWRGRNHNPRGWTPARQLGFMRALTRCGSARAAAAAVGKSVRSAYLLRDKPGAASFSAAWDQAAIAGRRAAVDSAIDRALHGELVPVFRNGRPAGTRLERNDRLLIGVFNAIGREVAGEARICGYEDIWNRLLDWENELNRRQMDLEDPSWKERSQAEAEIDHQYRIWRVEFERSKRLAYQRRVRAELKRQRDEDEALEREAGERPPRIRRL
jgi:hypothetical protein